MSLKKVFKVHVCTTLAQKRQTCPTTRYNCGWLAQIALKKGGVTNSQPESPQNSMPDKN